MAASLTATKIKDSYVELLHIDGGVTSTPKTVYDGDGTATALKISTTGIESTALTLSGGTANGVVYLNGSKAATTGSALTFDGTNLGVGAATPSTGGFNRQITINSGAGSLAGVVLQNNSTGTAFNDGFSVGLNGLNVEYVNNENGYQSWFTNATEQMRLTSTGLGIGTSSPISYANKKTLALQGAWGGQLDIMVGSTVHAQFGTDNYSSGLSCRIQSQDGIVFKTNGDNERMRLDSSGNLGLGVTPSAWSNYTALQVGYRSSLAGDSTYMLLSQNYFNNGSDRYIANGYATQYYQGNGAHVWRTAPSGTAGNAISFTQAMTLDASGNLGVGTTSPTAIGSSKVVEIGASSGNSAFQLFSVAGAIKASMYGNASEASVGSVPAIPLLFKTSDTERMRIDSSGNLLVGTTSTVGSAKQTISTYGNNLTALTVQNDGNTGAGSVFVRFYWNAGQLGSIVGNGASTAYNTSSDYRLKENIQPMQNALERNALLKPCTYSWKADGYTGEGFIAHELQAVCPDAVTGEKDAVDKDGNPVYQGVDTSFLVGHLVACIQELKAELDELKAKVG